MKLDELLGHAAELMGPADPVEIRVGSRLVIDALRHALPAPTRDPLAPFFGLPIVVDDALPSNRLEVRRRDGGVRYSIDLEISIAPVRR